MFRFACLLVLVAVFSTGTALADSTQKNIFASIYLKKNKIGHVHLTSVHGATGEIEDLRARVSVSIFGLKVYGFAQNHHEIWGSGELQTMVGNTDDNGTVHEVSLERMAKEYEVEYNGEQLVLPHEAFPTSPWHYEITEKKLLFSIVNFNLLEVEVSESPDTVTIGEETIPATRFDFTGDWEARLWFDEAKSFLKGEYDVAGRQVTVVIDP